MSDICERLRNMAEDYFRFKIDELPSDSLTRQVSESYIADIESAITEIEQWRSGWMPIESAPKSSKYILLWCPENKMTYECCWREDEDRWCVIGGHLLWQTPTKWRELPQPPQEPK